MAPGVSPASVLRIIRQRTSFRIFENFSHYRLQNPSGDFWAPGYLVLSGSSLPEETLLADFIQQTRQRQGIPIPRIL